MSLTFETDILPTPLGTVIIYARDMSKTAQFYAKHFGFLTTGEVCEGLIELTPRGSGVQFGAIHQANGYCFANAKDPDNNSVSVSSRAYRKTGVSQSRNT